MDYKWSKPNDNDLGWGVISC